METQDYQGARNTALTSVEIRKSLVFYRQQISVCVCVCMCLCVCLYTNVQGTFSPELISSVLNLLNYTLLKYKMTLRGKGDLHVVSNISVITRDLQQAQVVFISFLRNNLPCNVHYSLKAHESNTTLIRKILPQ